MNGYPFTLRDADLIALPSGALYWPDANLLCVSDLHLGKSDRMARRDGVFLPPYETIETLDRLSNDIAACAPKTVICLGDSFDDLAAARGIDEGSREMLACLMAGRRWIWIEGNHDPGPVDMGGTHLAEFAHDGLTFRHIAAPGKSGEISGHYHPKTRVSVRGRGLSRRCFLIDADRVILPAYGAYTGGLFSDRRELDELMGDPAQAVILPGNGRRPLAFPMRR